MLTERAERSQPEVRLQVVEQAIAAEEAAQPIVDRRLSALERLYSTTPTTLEGLAALVRVFVEEEKAPIEDLGSASVAMETISRAVQDLAAQNEIGTRGAYLGVRAATAPAVRLRAAPDLGR